MSASTLPAASPDGSLIVSTTSGIRDHLPARVAHLHDALQAPGPSGCLCSPAGNAHSPGAPLATPGLAAGHTPLPVRSPSTQMETVPLPCSPSSSLRSVRAALRSPTERPADQRGNLSHSSSTPDTLCSEADVRTPVIARKRSDDEAISHAPYRFNARYFMRCGLMSFPTFSRMYAS